MAQPHTTFLPHGAVFSNPVAACLHWVGDGLAWPTLEALYQGARVIEPITPGHKGQWSTQALEVVHRVLQVFAILILAPVGLLLAPAAIGLWVVSDLARRDFVFIKPESSPPQPVMPEQLTMSSYNAAYMPEFIARSNGIRTTEERSQEIPLRLQERSDDIVCLQEAFDENATLQNAHFLKEYPYKVLAVAHQTFGLNSGLALFSKYPLEKVTFWHHPVKGGVDKLANKGLLGAVVRLAADRVAIVFNTHLNGGASDDPKIFRGGPEYRTPQIAQIRSLVPQYVQSHREQQPQDKIVGVFLAGDFNIGPAEEGGRNPEWNRQFFRGEYQEYYAGDGPPPSFPRNPDDRGTGFCPRPWDLITGWDLAQLDEWFINKECLDHILVKQDPAPQFLGDPTYKRDRMKGGSDHLAIRATFPLKR